MEPKARQLQEIEMEQLPMIFMATNSPKHCENTARNLKIISTSRQYFK